MQLQCKYTLRYHFKDVMIQVSRQKRCTSKPGKGKMKGGELSTNAFCYNDKYMYSWIISRIINTDTTRFINLLSIDKM